MTLKLRKIQEADLPVLRDLAIRTFEQTFAHDNSPQQLADYFDKTYSLEVLGQELANPESLHILAEVNGRPAAFLKTNWGAAQIEKELDLAYETQRLYVLQEFQGQGIGRALFEYALQLAHESGASWAWLGVWEKNFKAQKFYAKYGFEKFSQHAFRVSQDKVDVDWLLKKKLK